MNDLQTLEQQILRRLSARDEHEQSERLQLQHTMAETEKRQARFQQLADEVIVDIVRPRMRKLAECFENAKYVAPEESPRNMCMCRFDHSARYPASVTLTLSATHDAEIESLLLVHDLQIFPIFFQFERHDQLLLAFDALDQARVERWVDERILAFVDTYLKVEQTEQYQRNSLVTDPVCRMRFRQSIASAESKHNGHTYYFCSQGCCEKFVANPEQYAST